MCIITFIIFVLTSFFNSVYSYKYTFLPRTVI